MLINVSRLFNPFFLISFFSLIASVSNAETLEQLIVLTLEGNPELQTSRLLRDASEAQVDSARWQYYPTPTLSVQRAEVSSNDSSFVGDSVAATVGFVQPLWGGGSITNNLKSAKASFELSDADVTQTQQSLALRVLSAYADWHSATLRVEAWQQGLLIHQDLSKQVQRRTSGGASSESDLALADARTSLTEAELFSAIAQQRRALSSLTELVGRTLLSSDLVDERPQPIQIDRQLSNLRNSAQEVDPGIIRALAEVDLAEAERRLLRSEQLPTVNLRVERQFGDLTFADSDPSNRIFLEVTSRFGAGLSGSSNVSAARLRRDAALSNVEAQRRALDATLMSDLALKDSIDRRLVALEKSKIATQAVYASFERQFLSGSRSWLDVLNSARELTQLDLQLADAESSLILVSWRLSILSEGLMSVLASTATGVSQ